MIRVRGCLMGLKKSKGIRVMGRPVRTEVWGSRGAMRVIGPWGSRVGIDLDSPGQFWFTPVGPS